MKLTEAAQAPLVLDIEFKTKGRKPLKLAIPYLTLEDFITWGNKVDSDYNDSVTKGMSVDQKFQILMFYGPMPSNLVKLKGLARTPDGVKYIVSTQLAKATVTQEGDKNVDRKLTPEEIADISAFPMAQLRELSSTLADIGDADPSDGKTEPQTIGQEGGKQTGGGPAVDPLPNQGGSDSKA